MGRLADIAVNEKVEKAPAAERPWVSRLSPPAAAILVSDASAAERTSRPSISSCNFTLPSVSVLTNTRISWDCFQKISEGMTVVPPARALPVAIVLST